VRLDRIMVNSGFEVTSAGTHQTLNARTASDHLPIWAELRATE
jgi:endonuclease/exonuclease/phosphatase family metal-dependent hydrolase